MAGSTFTIGGVPFAALSFSDGRFALHSRIDAPVAHLIRFHVTGTDGNLIVRDGRTGKKMVFVMRYIGTLQNCLDRYKADREAWYNTAVSITDDQGSIYARCNLNHMTRTTDPRGISRPSFANFAFFDAMATFDWDG